MNFTGAVAYGEIHGHDSEQHYHPHPNANLMPANPIPPPYTEVPDKLPEDYDDMRFHSIQARDHGCAYLPKDHDEAYGCVNIWLKNKFRLVFSYIKCPENVKKYLL